MKRRTLLGLVFGGSLGLIGTTTAGVSYLAMEHQDDQDSPDSSTEPVPKTGSAGNTPEPTPTVNWSESWIEGEKYEIQATVELNGAEYIEIRDPSDNVVRIISSSGDYTIAGADTEYGYAELGRQFSAYLTTGRFDNIVGTHFIGSQEQASFPVFLSGLHGSTDPSLEDTGYLERNYTQTVDGRRTAFSIRVPEILSKYYSNRYRTRNYGSYVSDTYDDRYIGSLVDEFESFGEKHGLSDIEIINQMMGFVQNLEYSRDKVSEGYNEYPKYPTETLVDRGGDCEDTCILLASLLEQFGYGTVLLAYFDDNHMALGLAGEEGIPGTYVEKGGQRYYYVETTNPGPEVGEAPEDLQNSTPEVLPINDHPVLVFSYAVQPSAKGGVNIDGSIHNAGDATAQNAQMKVEFQDPSERTTVAATSDSLTIPTEQDRSVNFPVQPPDDTEQRVKVSVLLDGQTHDWITSEYREPTNP